MSDVKRYDPINNDGTCGVCIEDADYGAYVEYADYAALESELAQLRAGQECQTLNQRAFIGTLLNSFPLLNDDGLDETEHHCEWHIQQERKRLHTIVDAARLSLSIATPQLSAVPDGFVLAPVKPTEEMLIAGDGYIGTPATYKAMISAIPNTITTEFSQFLSAVMDAAGLVRHGRQSKGLSEYLGSQCMKYRLAAAPSAPATGQGVNQQLLEALENTATWIEQLPVPTVGAAGQLVKIDKAIAAARKGEQ